ncbi:glutathione S-transferase GstA-like [Haliotis asinina]|uniref:glutathione S-transferase GstA-like n=1 Tax=Haliotis asinina TaxID=109174 RepID=UPI0035327C13
MADETKTAKSATMKLYQCPMYRSFRCIWLIHELEAVDDFEIVKLDSIKGKDSAEYQEYKRSVHPHGTIPALQVEGEGVIIESGAICLYLADRYDKLAPPIAQRLEYYDWALYAIATIDEAMELLYWQWAVKPEKPNPQGVDKMVAKMDTCMKRLTKALEGRQYICGNTLTAADCILGYSMWAASDSMFNEGSLVEDYPEVKNYVSRLSSRPAFKKAVSAQFE